MIKCETWGCDCVKEFQGYDLIVEIERGHRVGGKVLGKLVKPNITANFVWLEVSKDVIKNANKNLFVVTVYKIL